MNIFETIHIAHHNYWKRNGDGPEVVYLGHFEYDEVSEFAKGYMYTKCEDGTTKPKTLMGMEVVEVDRLRYIGFGRRHA